MSEKAPSTERGLVGVPAPRDGVVGTTLLIVSDQDHSREFYVTVLGASVVREHDPVVLRLGGMWLILNAGGGPTPDIPGITAAPPTDRSHFNCALNLRVADVRATWQQLKAAGAEFLTGPIDRGPEIRCYLHDPDGHLIEIGQMHTTSHAQDRGYAKTNLRDVKDSAAEHGLSGHQAARFPREDLGSEQTGMNLLYVKPGQREAFAHRHRTAEEIYVVIDGSGRVKLDDEFVELAPFDAVRVSPGITRSFEAGPSGLQVLIFGPRVESDAEVVRDFWGSSSEHCDDSRVG